MAGKIGLIAGAAAVLAAAGGAYYLVDRRAPDMGGGSPSYVQKPSVAPRYDSQAKVAQEEADRRASVNAKAAAEAAAAGKSYTSQTVITDRGPAERGESPESVPSPPEKPAPEIRYVYVAQPPAAAPQPVNDTDARGRVISQVDAIARLQEGGFVVRTFQKPEKKEPEKASSGGAATGAASTGNNMQAIPTGRLVARTGDVIYGVLDRGFNSDDPQAPLIVTLHDFLTDGSQGPLTGARVVGTLNYSQEQAAVQFSRLVMVDGREIPISAIAVSEQDARTGIAADVDRHILMRYGSLFASSLIQGVGMAGQQLTALSSNSYVVDPYTGLIASSPSSDWKRIGAQAAAASLLPVGQALASAAARNFNTPPTISSPIGMGVGVVFLQPLNMPF